MSASHPSSDFTDALDRELLTPSHTYCDALASSPPPMPSAPFTTAKSPTTIIPPTPTPLHPRIKRQHDDTDADPTEFTALPPKRRRVEPEPEPLPTSLHLHQYPLTLADRFWAKDPTLIDCSYTMLTTDAAANFAESERGRDCPICWGKLLDEPPEYWGGGFEEEEVEEEDGEGDDREGEDREWEEGRGDDETDTEFFLSRHGPHPKQIFHTECLVEWLGF